MSLMVENAPCLVCDKHSQADPSITLQRNDLVYVGHHPLGDATYRGHIFVEPLRHVRGLYDLTDQEASLVGLAVARSARALRGIGAEHVYSVVYGDRVPHLHVHLLPRWPGTPHEYWGPNVNQWTGAPRVDTNELAQVVGALKNALSPQ